MFVLQGITACIYIYQTVHYIVTEPISDMVEKICGFLYFFKDKEKIGDFTKDISEECTDFFLSKYWLAIGIYLGHIIALKASFSFILFCYHIEKKELWKEEDRKERIEFGLPLSDDDEKEKEEKQIDEKEEHLLASFT